jgi:hypothetical protein
MNESEIIRMLEKIWKATENIKTITKTLDDFSIRLQKMEGRCNNIWHQKGIQFMNDNGKNVEGIVDIFKNGYGNTQKISGYSLIKNVLNSYAKNVERKNLIFTSFINSLMFRIIEILSVVGLFILYFWKGD